MAQLRDPLIEREIRRAMRAAHIESLPRYPETRLLRAPTTDRLLDLFRALQHHELFAGSRRMQPQRHAAKRRTSTSVPRRTDCSAKDKVRSDVAVSR